MMTQSNEPINNPQISLLRRMSQKSGIYTALFRLIMNLNRRWGFDSVPHMDVFGDDDPEFMALFKIAR